MKENKKAGAHVSTAALTWALTLAPSTTFAVGTDIWLFVSKKTGLQDSLLSSYWWKTIPVWDGCTCIFDFTCMRGIFASAFSPPQMTWKWFAAEGNQHLWLHNWNRILQPFDGACIASHRRHSCCQPLWLGSWKAVPLALRCVEQGWRQTRFTGAACEQIRSGCLQEKVFPSLQRGKDTVVQSQRKLAPDGGQRGRWRERRRE